MDKREYQMDLLELSHHVVEQFYSQVPQDPDNFMDVIKVYDNKLLARSPEGLMSIPYRRDKKTDFGEVTFGKPTRVNQQLVAASANAPREGDGLILTVPITAYVDPATEERFVGGTPLVPGDDNAFDDIWKAEDIRIMSRRFMAKSQQVDVMHSSLPVALPVESMYLPTPDEGGMKKYRLYGSDVAPGSWWLGSQITDDDVWEKVKDGTLAAYSIFAVKVDVAEMSKTGSSLSYAHDRHKTGHRTMSADEWDITMVSLVDEPAVRKARLVIMRNLPTGRLSLVEHDGTPVPVNEQEVLVASSVGGNALTMKSSLLQRLGWIKDTSVNSVDDDLDFPDLNAEDDEDEVEDQVDEVDADEDEENEDEVEDQVDEPSDDVDEEDEDSEEDDVEEEEIEVDEVDPAVAAIEALTVAASALTDAAKAFTPETLKANIRTAMADIKEEDAVEKKKNAQPYSKSAASAFDNDEPSDEDDEPVVTADWGSYGLGINSPESSD